MSVLRIAACSLCLALALVPSVVRAEPSDADMQRAREIFQNGQSLYREGRYEDAMVAFEEAYKLSEKPGLLYNMASCSERMGNYREAIDQLNRYRVYAQPGERVALERRLTNLELRLADTPPEAPVVVAPPPPAPEPEPRFGSTGKGLLIAGGTTAVVGGGVQVFTYVKSVQWAADGDRATWETWQPVNLTAGSLAAVGGVMAVTGLILGANGIADTGPGLRVRPLGLSGTF